MTEVESVIDKKVGWVSCRLDSIVSLVPLLKLSAATDLLAREFVGDGAGCMIARLAGISCDYGHDENLMT